MIYELPDIPRIYTALAQCLACFVIIAVYDERRFRKVRLLALCGLFLAVQSVLLVTTADAPDFLWLLIMIISWAAMFLFIHSTCKMSAIDACYCAVHAFVLAEFAASLQWQIHCFIWPISKAPCPLAIALLCAVYALVYMPAWLILRRFVSKGKVLDVTGRHLLSAVIIGASVFAVSNLGFLTTQTPFSGYYHREIFNIRTIMGLCGLLFLGVYNFARRDMYVQQELTAVQGILRSQFEQYQHCKDKQDYINHKYHDLKHHIAYLKACEDSDRRRVFLDAMEKEIKEYELQFKTGSPVLDTILTSTAQNCEENAITLTCVADGARLDFMDVVDICTIFGNALDNAIEHVKKIKSPEKRLIHVTVFLKQEHLVIRVENYMEGELNFDGNLPVTTKPDVERHGYGLKSTRYVAEKYHGVMTVEEKNSWFLFQIVIPNCAK